MTMAAEDGVQWLGIWEKTELKIFVRVAQNSEQQSVRRERRRTILYCDILYTATVLLIRKKSKKV